MSVESAEAALAEFNRAAWEVVEVDPGMEGSTDAWMDFTNPVLHSKLLLDHARLDRDVRNAMDAELVDKVVQYDRG